MDHGSSGAENTSTVGAARRRFGRRTAIAVAVSAYAWGVVAMRPFSVLASAVVVLSGAVASVAGSGRRRPEGRTISAADAGPWAALAAASVAWELLAFAHHPRADHPTLSSMTNAVLDTHPARAAAFVLWLVAMRELSRR